MRRLLFLIVLGGCDGSGPPGVSLRGLCEGRIAHATPQLASPVLVTDIATSAYVEDARSLDLAAAPSDLVSVTVGHPSWDITLVGSRNDTGYLDLVVRNDTRSREWTARFVVVVAETAQPDPMCQTDAITVTDH